MRGGAITTRHVQPREDFGLDPVPVDTVRGGSISENAALCTRLLDGKLPAHDPILSFVLMQAAALLYVADKAATLKEGVALARQCITSGRAKKALELFRSNAAGGV